MRRLWLHTYIIKSKYLSSWKPNFPKARKENYLSWTLPENFEDENELS